MKNLIFTMTLFGLALGSLDYERPDEDDVPTCPSGYVSTLGDVDAGWGSIRSQDSVMSINDCARICNNVDNCNSFEYTSSSRICNLKNHEIGPTQGPYSDYDYCTKSNNGNSSTFTIFGTAGPRYESGLIFLHGLATPTLMNKMMQYISGPALGLSRSRNKVAIPMAPKEPVGVLPPTFVPGLDVVRTWFNFWAMPAVSVLSPIATESKTGLEQALKWVEAEIEEMIQEGIPNEKIVVAGASQGGALTLYTALHTKYKIGGFIPIVTWQPLLKTEPPRSMPTPINRDTPIFHMNGLADPIVPLICGKRTSEALEGVFTRYELDNVAGTHMTSINPITLPKIYCWLKKNVPGMAFSRISPFRLMPCF